MFENGYFQDICIICAALAFVLASLLNVTALPIISILGGLFGGVALTRFLFCKSKWNALSFEKYSTWQYYGMMFLFALVASQIGWAALLV